MLQRIQLEPMMNSDEDDSPTVHHPEDGTGRLKLKRKILPIPNRYERIIIGYAICIISYSVLF